MSKLEVVFEVQIHDKMPTCDICGRLIRVLELQIPSLSSVNKILECLVKTKPESFSWERE
jgi:hypothetical protein